MFLMLLITSFVMGSYTSPDGNVTNTTHELSFAVCDEVANAVEYTVTAKTAEVNMISGFYIFVESEPVKTYKFLGTVKKSMSLFGSGQYADMRDKLIKKVKRKYPEANGLIFHFKDGGADRVDIVQVE